MRKMWRRLFAISALACMLCLAGLVMSGEAQAQRFVDYGNGTVIDTMTNLMWTKNANPIGERNWDDAVSACSSFSISGIGGWRLPSRDELLALYQAMSRGHPFTRVQSSAYWSSTPFADNTDVACRVGMYPVNVGVDCKDSTYRVWPVRAGQ